MQQTIVKVQRVLASSHWLDPATCLIYGKNKSNSQEQVVPHKVMLALGRDDKGYFKADFRNGQWEIGRRAPDQMW